MLADFLFVLLRSNFELFLLILTIVLKTKGNRAEALFHYALQGTLTLRTVKTLIYAIEAIISEAALAELIL